MKGTNEKWTIVTKINFREKVAQNVDLVHVSIGHNTIQYNIKKTYKAPYVTKKLFVGAGVTRDNRQYRQC